MTQVLKASQQKELYRQRLAQQKPRENGDPRDVSIADMGLWVCQISNTLLTNGQELLNYEMLDTNTDSVASDLEQAKKHLEEAISILKGANK